MNFSGGNIRKSRESGDDDYGMVSIGGIRLNKCLTSLSRRGADDAILNGRVSVNGRKIKEPGFRVNIKDRVELDGKQQHFQSKEIAKLKAPGTKYQDRSFIYVKYWKPTGVTSTTNKEYKSNIIQAGQFHKLPQRMFTVGRLDKDSSGLILLTSDGRLNNCLLNPKVKKPKKYEVTLNKSPSDDEIQELQKGVMINFRLQRPSTFKGEREVMAKTLPCEVTRDFKDSKKIHFTLVEGRNRQIRKMCEVIGYRVEKLHRTEFAGIDLKGIKCGQWKELNEKEIKTVEDAYKTIGIV